MNRNYLRKPINTVAENSLTMFRFKRLQPGGKKGNNPSGKKGNNPR